MASRSDLSPVDSASSCSSQSSRLWWSAGAARREGLGPARSVTPPRAGPSGRQASSALLGALTLVGTALLGVGLVSVVGPRDQAVQQPNRPGQLSARFAGAAGGTPAERLSRLQDRVRTQPKDAPSWAALGSAYVESARITADPGYYPKAEGAFGKSLAPIIHVAA